MSRDDLPVALELGMVDRDLPFSDCKTWGARRVGAGLQVVELDPAGPVCTLTRDELRMLARYLIKLSRALECS